METQQGDQCGWSGIEEEKPSLEPDVRPSAGAQFLKQVQAQVLIPLMFFPCAPSTPSPSLLLCQAVQRKNRKDKSTAKIQP